MYVSPALLATTYIQPDPNNVNDDGVFWHKKNEIGSTSVRALPCFDRPKIARNSFHKINKARCARKQTNNAEEEQEEEEQEEEEPVSYTHLTLPTIYSV